MLAVNAEVAAIETFIEQFTFVSVHAGQYKIKELFILHKLAFICNSYISNPEYFVDILSFTIKINLPQNSKWLKQ